MTNIVPRRREKRISEGGMGWDQGRDWPPRLRAPRRETIVVARRKAPMKSMRRSFEVLPSMLWDRGREGAGVGEEVEEGSFQDTRRIARKIRGA